jgi:shikimate kinase/3-dehydroquinate synthase
MYAGGFNNLVLTGFMGTGKTSVGREVARRLHRPFVDMDVEIETQAEKSIPQIFAEDGEAAFRQMERALCNKLSARQGLVIATGGGALVDAANRERMMASGTVVCLTCEIDEIVARLNGGRDSDRPLLRVSDPRAEIERLLGVRHRAYSAIPWWIDTTGISVDEVADHVIKLEGVVTLPVRHSTGVTSPSYQNAAPLQTLHGATAGHDDQQRKSGVRKDLYPIHIGSGLLRHIGGALRATGVADGGRVALVMNPSVEPLYGDTATESLRTSGFESFACSIPDGEQYKSLDTVAQLYNGFLAGGMDRSGTVLALGGGVTGDVAGFAAASFLRGVRLVQVPTTLLAMVDSSVGGKTGVDLPQGKNLVGAFKQPALVVIDPDVLRTLHPDELRSGMAEVIKHGVIGAPELFENLESVDGQLSMWWSDRGTTQIARALQVKISVVEQDPYERGRRAVLNLGHTVGHALEKVSGYTLRHGEAVAIGMVAAARMGIEMGRTNPELVERLSYVLDKWGLPTECPPVPVSDIWQAMAHDKKRRGRALQWVLPRDIGAVDIGIDVPPHIANSVLIEMGARNQT